MSIGDWAGFAQSIATASAILVGAGWAYWRFGRERTYSPRAEQTVEGELLRKDNEVAVRVRVFLRNLGSTQMASKDQPLRAFAKVNSIRPPTWTDGDWKSEATMRVLTSHDYLEPQEPVSDEVLIRLADREPALAYRLEFVVFERREEESEFVQWTTSQVIGGALQPVSEYRGRGQVRGTVPKEGLVMGKESDGEDRWRQIGEQRAASEEDIRALEREVETRQRGASEEEVQRIEQEANQGEQQSDQEAESGDSGSE